MTVSPVLSLLGLALRGGNLAVGEEPVEAVARARDARLLILASDAADNTRRRVSHFADAGACIWIRVPFTKEELGRAVGRGGVAVCAVTDVGRGVQRTPLHDQRRHAVVELASDRKSVV